MAMSLPLLLLIAAGAAAQAPSLDALVTAVASHPGSFSRPPDDAGIGPGARELILSKVASGKAFRAVVAEVAANLSIPPAAAEPLVHATLLELHLAEGESMRHFDEIAPLLEKAVKLSLRNPVVVQEALAFHSDLQFAAHAEAEHERVEAWMERLFAGLPSKSLKEGLNLLRAARIACRDEEVLPQALKSNPALLCHVSGQLFPNTSASRALLLEKAWQYARTDPRNCLGTEDDLAREALSGLVQAGLTRRALAFYRGLPPRSRERVLDLAVRDAIHRECTVSPRQPIATLASLTASAILEGDLPIARQFVERLRVAAKEPEKGNGYWVTQPESLGALVRLFEVALNPTSGDVFAGATFIAESDHHTIAGGLGSYLPLQVLGAQVTRETYPQLSQRLASNARSRLQSALDPIGACLSFGWNKTDPEPKRRRWCEEYAHDDLGPVYRQFKLDLKSGEADVRALQVALGGSDEPQPPLDVPKRMNAASEACLRETGLTDSMHNSGVIFECAMNREHTEALIRWQTDPWGKGSWPTNEGANWARKVNGVWNEVLLWREHHS